MYWTSTSMRNTDIAYLQHHRIQYVLTQHHHVGHQFSKTCILQKIQRLMYQHEQLRHDNIVPITPCVPPTCVEPAPPCCTTRHQVGHLVTLSLQHRWVQLALSQNHYLLKNGLMPYFVSLRFLTNHFL